MTDKLSERPIRFFSGQVFFDANLNGFILNPNQYEMLKRIEQLCKDKIKKAEALETELKEAIEASKLYSKANEKSIEENQRLKEGLRNIQSLSKDKWVHYQVNELLNQSKDE